MWTLQAVGASERVFQLLDREPKLPPAGNLRPQGSPEGGKIEFKDVWWAVHTSIISGVLRDLSPSLTEDSMSFRFAYPSRPDAEVLKGVSLQVPPGKKLALVSESHVDCRSKLGLLYLSC